NCKVLIATILTVLGLTAAPLFNAARADLVLDADLSVYKATAQRGDTLTYTFRVENTLSDKFIVYLAPGMNGDHPFSPYVNYIPGSTSWTDNSGATGAVDDNWLNTGVNLNYLDVGDWVVLTFKAKVKADAPNGALAESVIQIKKTWLGEDVNEWFQCAAKTTIKVGEVLAAETLPQTGAEDIFAVSLYLGYLGFLVRRIKLTRYL
ncbi:MAG: hypothetical protein WDZ67_01925, partial [Patescibacteria group bacterium]